MSDFPDRTYVVLTVKDGVETLDFAPDLDGLDELDDATGPVAVYRLESVGRMERRFVEADAERGHTVEQRAPKGGTA